MHVTHAEIVITDILHDPTAVHVGFDADALVSVGEGAINHRHVRNAAGGETADANAMTEAERAIGYQYIRRNRGTAANSDIVVTGADDAVADDSIRLSEIQRIGVMGRIRRSA